MYYLNVQDELIMQEATHVPYEHFLRIIGHHPVTKCPALHCIDCDDDVAGATPPTSILEVTKVAVRAFQGVLHLD